MPLNSSILAFPDCRDHFERAIEAEKGIRIKFVDERAARMFAARCNKFRSLDRAENKKVYAENTTHSLYGRSVFDTIRVAPRPVDGQWFVYMEKIVINAVSVEDI